MTDAEKQKLCGRVRAMRAEIADWDDTAQAWASARLHAVTQFTTDGQVLQIEQPGVEGSVHRTTYTYDDRGRLVEIAWNGRDTEGPKRVLSYDATGRIARIAFIADAGDERVVETHDYDDRGRKTKVEFVPPNLPKTGAFHWSVEGSEFAYAAPGVVKLTTRYDERGLPYETSFHDTSDEVVRRVTLTRDSSGRVVREAMERTGDAPLLGCEDSSGPARSEDDLATMAALVALVFKIQLTTYGYDDRGRVVERSRQSGRLAEERTRYRYDDRDNPVEELTESHSREIGVNDDGSLSSREERTSIHDVRFEYTYDDAGNWTERIVSSRVEPDAPFRRTNVERRTFSYYPPE